MKIHDNIHQGHEKWDDWRSVRATASEFGKIFTGGGKVSGQRESYMRKCAIARKYKMPSWSGNKFTDRGHELEPIARDLFSELSGIAVKQVACVEHENGLCGGSPDGLIETLGGEIISGLEIKCYNYDKHLAIVEKGVLPTENKPQCHGLLWLTGFKSWQFMVYNPDAMPFDHRVIEVTPDQYTQDLGGEVLLFCEELDKRADEFIEDFEKTMNGVAMREAMPTLFAQLETGEEMVC